MKIKHEHKVNIPPELIESEKENFFTWLRSLSDGYENKKIYFRFERTSGIGTSTWAKCGNREKDITDYGKW